jgi:hypothetical protein
LIPLFVPAFTKNSKSSNKMLDRLINSTPMKWPTVVPLAPSYAAVSRAELMCIFDFVFDTLRQSPEGSTSYPPSIIALTPDALAGTVILVLVTG